MATITLKGNEIHTKGQLPEVGHPAPNFDLTTVDLGTCSLHEFGGKTVILNIFPSVDTGTCAMSVRKFNTQAANLENAVVLCISKDLPFAQKRFCGAEGLDNVVMLSEYKDFNFSDMYQVTILDGPLAGLMSRAIVVINEEGNVIYTEQVSEIADEPNYEAALKSIES